MQTLVREQDRQEREEEAIKRGIEQGIEQGSELKATDIAKKMIKRGVMLEDIVEFTGLSVFEIEQLN